MFNNRIACGIFLRFLLLWFQFSRKRCQLIQRLATLITDDLPISIRRECSETFISDSAKINDACGGKPSKVSCCFSALASIVTQEQENRYDKAEPWLGLDANFQVLGKYLNSIDCPSVCFNSITAGKSIRDAIQSGIHSLAFDTQLIHTALLLYGFAFIAWLASAATSPVSRLRLARSSRRIACKDDVKKRPLNNSMSKPRLEPHKADGRTMNVDRCQLETLKSAIN